ncbi:hypothetical protein G6F31_013783 [Rhizopus arrhizus]|nr:hypothetical protein G6F31_013783 [Rhizopus arrhizus]
MVPSSTRQVPGLAAGGDHAGGERHAGIAEVLGNRADHHHVQPEMRVDQRETDRGHQYGTAAAVIAVSLAHAAATGNRTARRLHRIPGQERHAGPQHGGGQPRQRRGERAQAGDAGEDEDGIDGRAGGDHRHDVLAQDALAQNEGALGPDHGEQADAGGCTRGPGTEAGAGGDDREHGIDCLVLLGGDGASRRRTAPERAPLSRRNMKKTS